MYHHVLSVTISFGHWLTSMATFLVLILTLGFFTLFYFLTNQSIMRDGTCLSHVLVGDHASIQHKTNGHFGQEICKYVLLIQGWFMCLFPFNSIQSSSHPQNHSSFNQVFFKGCSFYHHFGLGCKKRSSLHKKAQVWLT